MFKHYVQCVHNNLLEGIEVGVAQLAFPSSAVQTPALSSSDLHEMWSGSDKPPNPVQVISDIMIPLASSTHAL